MDYTIFILLLPVLSFLVLALAGMKMGHKTAGIIGTLSLVAVAVLSWWAAADYFSMPRQADGTLAPLMPYNVEWLPFNSDLHIASVCCICDGGCCCVQCPNNTTSN